MSARKKVAELAQELERAKADAFDAKAKVMGLHVLLRRAETERDEARRQAVWAERTYSPSDCPWAWVAVSPSGRHLTHHGWRRDGTAAGFPTEAEALAAGRAVPWWT